MTGNCLVRKPKPIQHVDKIGFSPSSNTWTGPTEYSTIRVTLWPDEASKVCDGVFVIGGGRAARVCGLGDGSTGEKQVGDS